MTRADYHLPPIPDGFQIYEERLEVAGLAHRKADAARFARGKQKALEWEPEPGNRYDKNAIRLIGCHKGIVLTKRTLLGYVPKEVAKTLVERGLVADAQPRLLKTYVSDGGFVEVLFQIVGPKACISEYKGSQRGEERQHYTDAVEQVKQLKREKRHDEAIALSTRALSRWKLNPARTVPVGASLHGITSNSPSFIESSGGMLTK